MELTLKKRLIGILILIAVALLITPFFFGQSVPIRELQLSARQPSPPALPVNFNMPIPPQAITTPPLAKATPATATLDANARIVTEQVQTLAATDASPSAVNIVAADASPSAVNSGWAKRSVPTTGTNPTAQTTPASSTEQATPATTIPSVASATATTQSSDNAPSTSTPSAMAAPNDPLSPIPASATNAAPGELASNKTMKLKPLSSTVSAIPNQPAAQHHPRSAVASPDAFAVQLGSFSDKMNAESLMKKLQAQGFTAYIHTTKTATGTWVRVLVGPELRRADAQALQSKLQKVTNLPGMVVKAGFK